MKNMVKFSGLSMIIYSCLMICQMWFILLWYKREHQRLDLQTRHILHDQK